MDWVAKNRATGEIVSITRMSCGSKEEITYLEKDGVQHTLLRSDFDDKFERIEQIDFSFVMPAIMEGCRENFELQKLVFPIARKCTPDYYKEGDFVYLFCVDSGLSEFFGKIGQEIHYSIDQKYIFEIVKIEKQPNEPGLYWLCLDYFRGPGKTRKDVKYPDLKVPLQLIRPFARDASMYLKRIDMPY